MSRSYIYQLLKTDASSSASGSLGIQGLNPENIYTSDVDEPKGRRFIVLRYGNRAVGIGPSNRTGLVVWMYDRDKDHDFIEAMLVRVRTLLEEIEAQKTLEGWITKVEWTGNGGDFYDEAYRAVGITSGYQVIASGR